MHVFILFLAWAVVSGSSAWSSSEVSCFSCGSECQKACGTRIFRACCFNFQRRRRSGGSDYSLKELDDSDSTEEDGSRSREQLPQLFRSLLRQGNDFFVSPSQPQDSWLLSSLYPSLDLRSDLRGEDADEGAPTALLSSSPSQGHADGRSLAPWDSEDVVGEDPVSRRAEMGFRRPGQILGLRRQALRMRYPPSQAKIRK
ncbi:uncharacterized protein Trissin [Palaemon carinicauda]|uniref:uncharacterized protein Trissin n=1 Tax=Palaemon carinicauda TaxID=392227 RepID=UPI0035B65A4E